MMGALASRAASREAITVEEEVTFCKLLEPVYQMGLMHINDLRWLEWRTCALEHT